MTKTPYRILIFSLLLLGACHFSSSPQNSVCDLDPALTKSEDGIYYQGIAFSGILYRLDKQNRDTLYRAEIKHGKYNGTERIWYFQHQLQQENSYSNGMLDGVQRRWYPNGKSKSLCTYRENKLEGVYLEWSESGLLVKELKYKDGNVTMYLE